MFFLINTKETTGNSEVFAYPRKSGQIRQKYRKQTCKNPIYGMPETGEWSPGTGLYQKDKEPLFKYEY